MVSFFGTSISSMEAPARAPRVWELNRSTLILSGISMNLEIELDLDFDYLPMIAKATDKKTNNFILNDLKFYPVILSLSLLLDAVLLR